MGEERRGLLGKLNGNAPVWLAFIFQLGTVAWYVFNMRADIDNKADAATLVKLAGVVEYLAQSKANQIEVAGLGRDIAGLTAVTNALGGSVNSLEDYTARLQEQTKNMSVHIGNLEEANKSIWRQTR
jgi:hypothetical protein